MKPVLLLIVSLTVSALAYSTSSPKTGIRGGEKLIQASSRRSLLGSALATAASTFLFRGVPPAIAADDDADPKLTDVYFGVGCFWHIQHEFVEAERELLGRNDHQLTSKAGYAGGKSTGSEGRVCYHNLMGVADYGKLGHGEVVGMTLPEQSIGEFAKVYFSLFSPKGGM
jgi:hypothetical protein